MKRITAVISSVLLTLSFTLTASANSIWNEKIESFPYEWYWLAVICATLLIEFAVIFAVVRKKPAIVLGAAALANAASFLIPRIVISAFAGAGSLYLGGYYHLADWVSVIFLIVTLAIEMPILWSMLKKYVKSVPTLLFMTFVANFVTTVGYVIVEKNLYNYLNS
ncbi:MAG: hypothetical protein IIU14_06475 [Ruminococcus sp.]|nr:hypothetical protein [Ruminococcus sp.]